MRQQGTWASYSVRYKGSNYGNLQSEGGSGTIDETLQKEGTDLSTADKKQHQVPLLNDGRKGSIASIGQGSAFNAFLDTVAAQGADAIGTLSLSDGAVLNA